MVKGQAMLTEEEISGHDQKMFPNVQQANDGCKKGIPKGSNSSTNITEQGMKRYYYSLMAPHGSRFTFFP